MPWRSLAVALLVMLTSGCDAEGESGRDNPESALVCSSSGAECPTLPTISPERVAVTSEDTCPGSSSDFFNQIGQALTAQSSEFVSLTTNIEICAAEQRISESGVTFYDVVTRDQPVSGVLFAGRKAPGEVGPASEFWLFAFIDDRDVTSDLFGDGNLVRMGDNGAAVSVPFTIPLDIDFRGGLLTFLLVDRYFSSDTRAGGNFAYHRVVINEVRPAALPPVVQRVMSDDSVSDPFPQTLVLGDAGDVILPSKSGHWSKQRWPART